MKALYEGERERAEELLPLDEELAMFEAAAFGRIDPLLAILDDDPTQAIVLSSDGFTPLHLACFAGGPAATRLLVERGADLERVSEAAIARVRPLGTTAFSRDRESAKILLEAGADPNGAGTDGSTPTQTARANGDEEMIRLLRSHGADAGSAGAG